MDLSSCAHAIIGVGPLLICLVASFVLTLAGVALPETGAAQSARHELKTHKIATAGPGTTFHQGGVALETLIKIKLLPRTLIDLVAINSAGSIENMRWLAEKKAAFALVQGMLGHDGREGQGAAASIGPQANLRAVTMLWPRVEHFIVHDEHVKTGTISDLLTLEDGKLSFGNDVTSIASSESLLSGLGLDLDDDVESAEMDFWSGIEAFAKEDLAAVSIPAVPPSVHVSRLMDQEDGQARILEWSETELALGDASRGLWQPFTIAAGTYPGQREDIVTIAQPIFLAVDADVDEEVVYKITGTIFENLAYLRQLYPPFRSLSLDNALSGLPVPLHPGASRYFQEVGIKLATPGDVPSYTTFDKAFDDPTALKTHITKGLVSLIIPEDGVSDQMIDDLVNVTADSDEVRLLPLKGRGTAHNLADLFYTDGIDLAVLQRDAMAYALQRNVYPDLTNNIRYLAKIGDSHVHVLAAKDILSIDDLRGKKVNFGPDGSGSEVTASILFTKLGVPVEQVSMDHKAALLQLQAGEIAAMVYVAPKPLPLLRSIEVRDGFRLLQLPLIEFADASQTDNVYAPATLTEKDYPSLIFGDRTIETITTANVIVSYDWPVDGERYRRIVAFAQTMFDREDALKGEARHPHWRQVDLLADLPGWKRHDASTERLKALVSSVRAKEARGGPLVSSPGRMAPAAVGASKAPIEKPTRDHRRPIF